MKIIIICLLIIVAFYIFLEYRRLSKAIILAHTTPDQTGEYDLGSAKKQLNVLLLGDSIAAGTGIEKFEQSLGGRLAKKLSQNYHVHLSNRAELGYRVSDLAQDKISGKWDLVIVVAGSNDLIHRVKQSQFKKSLNRLVENLQNNSKHIVLVGPGRVSAAHVLPLWMRFGLKKKQWQIADIMKQIALNHKVTYTNPLEHPISQSYFSADGLHPNVLGHKIWYEIIWEKIGPQYR